MVAQNALGQLHGDAMAATGTFFDDQRE